jgi:DNA-binding IclR family transcriptional regulator
MVPLKMKDSLAPKGARAALRAIRLLKLFSPQRSGMSLLELSLASNLHKTTAHRLLRALQSEGLIAHDPVTRRYSLGPGLMALGVQALTSSDLRRRVRPLLKALAKSSGETAMLEVPIGHCMLILDEVAGTHMVGAVESIGTLWPLHATSSGKAFLAFDDVGIDRLGYPLEPWTRRRHSLSGMRSSDNPLTSARADTLCPSMNSKMATLQWAR